MPSASVMTPLAARVLRAIRHHGLVPANARVLVGLSGGSDSVALLHLLLEIQAAGSFQVAGVAHVHHGLRGEAADRDEAFCRGLAAVRSLPYEVERLDVADIARRERRSLEDAARGARSEALQRAAAALSCDRIAVGHTRDDQAETVLLRLFRGAGPRGLRAVHPRAGATIRPLLDISRDELRSWLLERDIPFVEDETNADLRFRRNAVRHRVLPVLRDVFGPSAAALLARQADVAREDETLLASLTVPLAAEAVRADGSSIRVDREALAGAPLALRRRVLIQAMSLAGVREPGFEHVSRLLALAEGEGDPGPLALPGGVRAERREADLVLSRELPAEVEAGDFRYELTVPGRIWVPEARRTLDARSVPAGDPAFDRLLRVRDPAAAVVRGDGLTGPLAVRNWRPGDAFRPLGLGGRKKLQDVFVDRKVPRAERSRLPLVVDRQDRIVWVPGHTVDEAYRVTGDTRAVVVLTVSESGGRE